MVASTVYQNRDLLLQICGILNTYGYHVINSEYGTLHPPLGMNNTDACIAAVEFQRAIAIDKPRRFIAHSFVTFSRKLLAQYMYSNAAKTQRNNFEIQSTSVMDSVKVIDMYNDAVQINLAYEERKYHWVQEFFRPDEALRHVETLFRDIKRVESELANLNNPVQ